MSNSSQPDADGKARILRALENPNFKWRTIKGVASEVKLSQSGVLEVLGELASSGLVVRSSVASSDGEDLYTTRKHYVTSTSWPVRFLAALRNRGA